MAPDATWILAMTRPIMAQTETVDTVWRLQTHWGWAPWITVLGVAGVVGLVAVCYRYEVTPAGNFYRGCLSLLRLTTVALLLLMLSEAVLSGARTGKPRFGIVLDRSQSMQRTDVQLDDVQRDVESEVTSREEAARSILLKQDAQLLRQLERQYELEIALVDTNVETNSGASDTLIEALREPPDTSVDASATRLGDALGQLIETPSVTPLQGVLLLTDGQTTLGRPLSEAAEAARRSATPLYFVGIGSETLPPETDLTDLIADETAFVDDLVRFQATLNTRGLEGQRMRIDLLRDGSPTPVASKVVIASEQSQLVRLIDRPTTAGTFRYTLRVTALESDEKFLPDPAELTHTLTVRDDPIRVLLAAGYPNYEYRYLKHLLERDETLELATHLQESDAEYAESDLTAIGRFPLSKEALEAYDVVILIDLDPTLLPRSLWGNLEKYVGQSGGGLALIAGPRSLPSMYRNRKEFVALCPTDLTQASPGGWNLPRGFRAVPTELGKQEASLELADTPADSDRVWRSLPSFYWRADVGPPKPAARVLASDPGAALVDGKSAPLIVTQYYGSGRVRLHAIDSTWRWRYRVGDVYFARYWIQTIRHLARGKRVAAEEAVELATTRDRYEPGEPVRLRLNDQRSAIGSETNRTVLLQTSGRPDRQVELSAGTGGSGRFQVTLNDLAAGRYRAVFAEGETPAVAEFEVAAPPGESARPEMNRPAMTAAAERTRGAFLTFDEADKLPDLLPKARPATLESLPPIELWNRWPLLLAITACLTSEWILRKRRSML